jgi:hypothetical protein
MTIKSFRKWLRCIYGTQEDELDCESFARVIPQYVDIEVAGGQADVRFPKIKHHMTQCFECCDLHHALYDIALMESRETHHKEMRAEPAEPEPSAVASERVTLEPS